jgi:hypothetical protein
MRVPNWGRSRVVGARALLATTLCLLPACGNSTGDQKNQGAAGSVATGGSGGTVQQPSDSDDFLEAQGRAYCTRLFRCFEGNDDFMTERLLLKTAAGCEAELHKVNARDAGRRDLQAQLAAGALHYAADAAEKCLAELSACNGVNSFTRGSCREAYEGSAATGDACQRSEDCAGDAYCAGEGFHCPGQCQPRKASGEPCADDDDCSYSSGVVRCDYAVTPSVCRTWQKGPNAGLGEVCTRKFSAATTFVNCNDDLWCGIDAALGADAADGRCVAPLKAGDACGDGDDVCLGGLCDTTQGVCVQATLRSKAGETCDETSLTACDPILGLSCNDQGSCDGSGDGTEGSDCFGGDFQRGCGSGLFCAADNSATKGTCQPWLPAGAACAQNSACESGECNTTCEARYCGL